MIKHKNERFLELLSCKKIYKIDYYRILLFFYIHSCVWINSVFDEICQKKAKIKIKFPKMKGTFLDSVPWLKSNVHSTNFEKKSFKKLESLD